MPWATRTEAAALLLLVVLAPGCSGPAAGPNILLVTIDTLRRDHVGAYGDGRGLTPNLDALAATGLVHERAYTTMPTTGPAHLSAFTGLYPSEHGARSNGEPLPPRFASRELAQRMRFDCSVSAAGSVAGCHASSRWWSSLRRANRGRALRFEVVYGVCS